MVGTGTRLLLNDATSKERDTDVEVVLGCKAQGVPSLAAQFIQSGFIASHINTTNQLLNVQRHVLIEDMSHPNNDILLQIPMASCSSHKVKCILYNAQLQKSLQTSTLPILFKTKVKISSEIHGDILSVNINGYILLTYNGIEQILVMF